MAFLDTVNKLRAKLGQVDNSKLKGTTAVYQFELTGDSGGIFHVQVNDGQMELIEAAHETPNITITISTADFDSLLEGNLSATSAFMAGKLKVKGDMSLAMKLQGLFS